MKIALKALNLLKKSDRLKLFKLGFGILLNAILEVLTIGLIFPFIAVVNDVDVIQANKYLKQIYDFFEFNNTADFLIALGVVILILTVIKNIFFYVLVRAQVKFSYIKASEAVSTLFNKYLFAPYQMHLQRNSADLITRLDYSVDIVFTNIISTFLILLTELCTFFALVLLLFFAEPFLSMVLLAVLGGFSLILLFWLKNKMITLGEENVRLRLIRLKHLQQGLGAIKEVKILGKQDYFSKSFKEVRFDHAQIQAQSSSLNQIPRPALETIIIGGLILIIILTIHSNDEYSSVIPTLGLFGAACMRLMPAIYRIIGNYNIIQNSKASLDDILEDWNLENGADTVPDISGAETFKKLELSNVSFNYDGSDEGVLNDVSLSIEKGEFIGFVGVSGAGKSTLFDIMLGLLPPTKGSMLFNGEALNEKSLFAWRSKIGYVPQTITLIDETLAQNVAFGVNQDDLDEEKVWNALRMAHLEEFVKTLPDGLETKIGENGVKLSGGQRQRLGIARALYNDPELIFFDEATSALDNENEREITKAILGLKGNKTLCVIAHRLHTIEQCDRIVLMEDGKITGAGDFESLKKQSPAFKKMLELGNLIKD